MASLVNKLMLAVLPHQEGNGQVKHIEEEEWNDHGSSSETPTLEMDTGISSEYKFDASDVMICTKELKANL